MDPTYLRPLQLEMTSEIACANRNRFTALQELVMKQSREKNL